MIVESNLLRNIISGIGLMVVGVLMMGIESVPLITNIAWIFLVVGIAFTGISLFTMAKN